MRIFALYDHDFRFLYLSNTSDGVGCPSQFYGTLPWDWVEDHQVDHLKFAFEQVKRLGEYRYGIMWKAPHVEKVSVFYYCRLKWVGLTDVAIVSSISEFPVGLGEISPAEERALLALGQYGDIKSAAKSLGRSPMTVYNQIARIKEKIGLDSGPHQNDAIEVFADRYYQSVEGPAFADTPYDLK